jgi:hypothetical protein
MFYIKPTTLSRADSLTEEVDQYKQLVEQLVFMVKDIQVMRYSAIKSSPGVWHGRIIQRSKK